MLAKIALNEHYGHVGLSINLANYQFLELYQHATDALEHLEAQLLRVKAIPGVDSRTTRKDQGVTRSLSPARNYCSCRFLKANSDPQSSGEAFTAIIHETST